MPRYRGPTPIEREAQRRASRSRLRRNVVGLREGLDQQPSPPTVGTTATYTATYPYYLGNGAQLTQNFWNDVGDSYAVGMQIGQTQIGQTYNDGTLVPQITYEGNSVNNYQVWVAAPIVVVQHVHLFENSLEDIHNQLCAQLRAEIAGRYQMNPEDIWRSWTITAQQYDSWDGWVYQLTARMGEFPPTQPVWEDWQQAVEVRPEPITPPQPSQEEIRRRNVQRERDWLIASIRTRARDMRRRVAKRKARDLLLSVLTPEQRADLERANHFEVITASGRRYQVARGYAGNVYLVDDEGRRVERYCIHTYEGGIPDEDHMLSQKLLLEADEEDFRRIANITRLIA